MRGRVVASRAGEALVRRVMRSDVAQAVEALRVALLTVDRHDQAVYAASTPLARADRAAEREKARALLRRARTDLDTILLGDDDE